MRPDLFRPVHHAGGCPFQMGLMALGPMLLVCEDLLPSATTNVRSHSLSLVKDLYRGRGGSNLHQFVDQVVRNAVEIGIEGDVVINIHPGARPLAQVKAFRWQRTQSVLLDRSEQTGARSFTLPERSMVQAFE